MSHDTYHVGPPETYRPYSCHSPQHLTALPKVPDLKLTPFRSGGICSELQPDFSKAKLSLSRSQSKGHITDPRHVQRPSAMLKMLWKTSAHRG